MAKSAVKNAPQRAKNSIAMEAALFQDTPALLAAQLDPKTQKAAEEAFAQQQRSNPRQLASELVSCLGNAQLNPAVRQLAATLSKRFTAPRRALGALGEWNSQAVDGFRSALWQALASGPEPPVARALCVAVAEEASDANQPWPAASSNCVAGLGAAPGSPQATVALTLCAVGGSVLVSRRWRGGSGDMAGRGDGVFVVEVRSSRHQHAVA